MSLLGGSLETTEPNHGLDHSAVAARIKSLAIIWNILGVGIMGLSMGRIVGDMPVGTSVSNYILVLLPWITTSLSA